LEIKCGKRCGGWEMRFFAAIFEVPEWIKVRISSRRFFLLYLFLRLRLWLYWLKSSLRC
jgi:hypothetical protein